jgi:hypothetical protein
VYTIRMKKSSKIFAGSGGGQAILAVGVIGGTIALALELRARGKR